MTISLLTQQVTIDAMDVNVSDMSIAEGFNKTLQMNFVVDEDMNPGFVPDFGQEVIVTQTCDGVQAYQAEIHTIDDQRGTNYTRWRVTARGVSQNFAVTRFIGDFGQQSLSDLLSTVFGTYLPGVPTSIDSGAPVADEFASVYGSVADVVNFATNSSQWVWRASSGTFEFFDPTANVQSDIVQEDFERGSLKVNRSLDGVYNIARQQAYRYINIRFARTPFGGLPSTSPRCFNEFGVTHRSSGYPDGIPLSDWEFVGVVDFDGVRADDGPINEVTFQFNSDKAMITSSESFNSQFGSYAVARFRRIVWTEVRHESSISEFGEREAPPLNENNGIGVNESLRRLEQYLNLRAFPTISLDGTLLRSDVRPGERRRVVLPSFGIDTELIFEDIRRTTRRTELDVRVSASSLSDFGVGTPSNPAATGTKAMDKAQVLPEIFHRLEQLENSRLSELGRTGVINRVIGPIRSTAEFESAGMTWQGEFTSAPLSFVLEDDSI